MKSRAQGFTLVEVLVALIVISVGLLGVAKLQAVALSSTGIAGKRSMAALEAAGLASAMHADRSYWSAITAANTTVTALGNSFTSSDPILNPGALCQGPTCSVSDMASYDLAQWAKSALSTLGTTYKGFIVCQPAVLAPVEIAANCQITLQWTENIVATDTTQAAAAQANLGASPKLQTPTYVLFVTP